MTDTSKHEDSIPFYPDHVRTEFRVVLGVLFVLFIIGLVTLLSPVGLGAPADPLDTPAHIKPEWYFTALYQLLKFIPKTVGVVIPLVAAVILALWPFLDRKADKSPRTLRVRFIVVSIIMVFLIVMTIWGERS